jgi:hypothetical protein
VVTLARPLRQWTIVESSVTHVPINKSVEFAYLILVPSPPTTITAEHYLHETVDNSIEVGLALSLTNGLQSRLDNYNKKKLDKFITNHIVVMISGRTLCLVLIQLNANLLIHTVKQSHHQVASQ